MDKNGQSKIKPRAKKKKGRVTLSDSPSEKINCQKMQPIFEIRCDQHKHCLENFDGDVKKGFATTLHTMAKMTWQMIENSGRKGLGYEKMSLDKIIPQSPIKLTPDTRIKIFRITNESRMAGVRLKDNIFTILWIAPKHDLYK